MKKQVRERLLKSGLREKFGDISYPTTRDALRDISTLEATQRRRKEPLYYCKKGDL